MFASRALARKSSATSVFRHMPVIPGLGIFLFTILTLIILLFLVFKWQ
jgi:hypothetical protein